MPVPRVAVVAPSAVAVIISCGVSLMAVRGGQDPIFSEAQAYERFMGRWSRELAPLLVRFAAVRDGDTLLDVTGNWRRCGASRACKGSSKTG